MIGDELWAWQVLEDGEWGSLAMTIPELGNGVLVTRNQTIAREYMRPIAEEHARESGLPVRLARFTLAEVVEEVKS